jgi:hypothetical protein
MNNRRQYRSLIGAFVLIAALLVGINAVQSQMIDIRTEHELTDTAELDHAPPVVAFVCVALGGFRGLMADVLFLRLQLMQEEENFFEMVQLSDWVVKLQPKMTGVAAFLGWNMSYNISVTFSDCDDRWRWVQRGIELIRDQALVYNQGDPELYRELGWLYQHKVGQILDDCNLYYKSQLALQVMEIVGTQDDIDWQRLAETPETWDDLQSEVGEDFSKLNAILLAQNMSVQRLEDSFRTLNTYPLAVRDEIDALPFAGTLELFLRRRWLVQQLKLDPEKIVKINAKHGRLDFRLPEAHAIYWATEGLASAPNNSDVGCHRMVTQGLKDALTQGRLHYITESGMPFLGANLAIVDAVTASYLEAAEAHPDNNSFWSGYENHMKDSLVLLYISGNTKKAREYWKTVKSNTRYSGRKEYRMPFDDYALQLIAGDVTARSPEQIRALVLETLIASLMSRATGQIEKASQQDWIGAQIHERFDRTLDKTERKRMRMQIGDLNTLRRQAIKVALVEFPRRFPAEIIANLEAELRLSNVDLDDIRAEIEEQKKNNTLFKDLPKIQRQ